MSSIFGFLWVLALAGSVGAVQTSDSELVVGVKEAAPFSMQGSTGKWRGLTIDLWRQVAEELQLRYRIEEFSELDELLDATEQGRVDLAAAAITITAERERRLDFSHPYFESGLGIAVTDQQESDLATIARGLLSGRRCSANCGFGRSSRNRIACISPPWSMKDVVPRSSKVGSTGMVG